MGFCRGKLGRVPSLARRLLDRAPLTAPVARESIGLSAAYQLRDPNAAAVAREQGAHAPRAEGAVVTKPHGRVAPRGRF
jgi:hypothetical protein